MKPFDNHSENKAKGYSFKTARLVVYIPIFLISFIVGIAGYFIFNAIVFGTDASIIHVNGLTARGVIPDFVYCIAIAIALLTLSFTRIFGRPIVYALCTDDEKERAKEAFKSKSGILPTVSKIAVPVISLLIAVFTLYTSNNDCIGFNDKEIVVPPIHGFTASYDDITVYQVELWADDVGQISDSSEEYYYIIKHSGGFYPVPIMQVDSSEGKQFTKQLEENSIEVVTVHYEDDIPGFK